MQDVQRWNVYVQILIKSCNYGNLLRRKFDVFDPTAISNFLYFTQNKIQVNYNRRKPNCQKNHSFLEWFNEHFH